VLWFYVGLLVISVASNVIRNALLTFFHGTGNQAAFHWLHNSWGGDLYSAGILGLLLLLLKGLDRWIAPDASEQLDPEPET
jgi:cyanoexosortase B